MEMLSKELKLKIIQLIQEYFDEEDAESIAEFGYCMPCWAMQDIMAQALFNKSAYDEIWFKISGQKHKATVKAISQEEKEQINSAFAEILESGAVSFTKSRKAVRVSEAILNYGK
jgi:hypothetical protein